MTFERTFEELEQDEIIEAIRTGLEAGFERFATEVNLPLERARWGTDAGEYMDRRTFSAWKLFEAAFNIIIERGISNDARRKNR